MVSTFYKAPAKQFRWNWGAFMFGVVFGFAHKTWPAYLCFIPGFNLIWMFVCGGMAEKWVWDTGHFEDGKTFREVMDSWNRGGKCGFVLTVIVLTILAVASIAILLYWQKLGVKLAIMQP